MSGCTGCNCYGNSQCQGYCVGSYCYGKSEDVNDSNTYNVNVTVINESIHNSKCKGEVKKTKSQNCSCNK